jgi:steroid 5-alpha reductase family enzyme
MNPYTLVVLTLLLYMTLWFAYATYLKRDDVADTAWGLGFVLVAWVSFMRGEMRPVALVTTLLVTIWGVRLASHIHRRNSGKPEDKRYIEMRQNWKYGRLSSYLHIFLLQGFFLFVVVQPVIFINLYTSNTLKVLQMIGILIWMIGFYFESVGDAQLAAHIKDPANKGKLMTTGLWRYTRHPNYFGEVTQWWGIGIIALAISGGWVTLIGPLFITYLICFVSGVPMLEKKYAGRPDWEEYKKKTSVFIPLTFK